MNIPETLSGPDWAKDCDQCAYGIVAAPDILTAFPMHESRAVQAAEELVLFCDCRAGHMYRQCLRRIHNSLSMESRRNILAHIAAVSVPTIHGA